MSVLTAVYDLRTGPIAYDFVTWLVRARLEQQRAKAEQLHVVLLPNLGGLGDFARHWGSHDAEDTRWRLWNIVMPACALANATVTLAPTRDTEQLPEPLWYDPGKSHLLGPLVQAAREGERIPQLAPSVAAQRYANRWARDGHLVTITLRHNNPTDGRDSSDAWLPFVTWLRARHFTPVIVPDTAHVLRYAEGCLAALSIDLRAALYRVARMNCFVNNGPLVLAWHTGAPYIAFNAALPEDVWREHWRTKLLLNTGDQIPWATTQQRLVYKADSLETLMSEFSSMLGL